MTDPRSLDFYELLAVPRTATEEEIKKSYRRLARELHPDANGGDTEAEERFKLVTVAYETLGDPERRRRYDALGPEGLRNMGPGAAGFEDLFGAGLGDLFSSLLGGAFAGGGMGGRRAGPPRGPDLETAVDLSLRDTVFGATREIKLRAAVACTTCEASGARPGTSATQCTTCSGTGEIRRVRQSILGQMVTASVCSRCGGSGEEIASPCSDCRGEGRRTEERSYTIEVPAGVSDGATLKIAGRGGVGPRGGPAGDLYVRLRVAADDRLRRQGQDLVAALDLGVAQAALGARVRFETLDGPEEIDIPRGTQSGRIIRLRGKGVPEVGGRSRGDLLIEVAVRTPTDLTEDQDRLLRQLAESLGQDVAPAESGFFARVRSAFK
ncbi:MAG: molecular chaperone DnaJ [Acidimicrobiales bacterium]